MTTYVMRFINNVRRKVKQKVNKRKQDEILEVCRTEQLCVDEINHAETYWIRTIQANSFSSEIQFLRNGNQEKENAKCYVCLFTCAPSRAVHLELLRSLTVESFLPAFRPFVSRRGLPAALISDNAKTFKGSSKEVQKIARSKEVMHYQSNNRVSWKFIVEKAPWWGGFWERLIQSVKS